MLKIAQNRKEVKKAIHMKHIILNNKLLKDEKNIASLFDVINIIPAKKYYKIGLTEKGKFKIDEIKKEDSDKKISKIIDKKILKGKKTQLNLSDGRNFISNINCNINDSILINLKDKKIDKCLSFKEKANVIVFQGKHAGEKGNVNKVGLEHKMAELDINKKKVNVLIKQLMVVE